MIKDLKIEIGNDGDPTEESLKRIENLAVYAIKLPLEQREGVLCEVLDKIVSVWEGTDIAKGKDGLYVFYTGNFSINEKLITAFMQSAASLFVNHVSLDGVFYAIAVTEEAEEKLIEIKAEFVEKLWSCVRDDGK
jgi:hypothetical protein